MSIKNEDKDLLDELIRIKNLIGRMPKTKDIEEHSKYSINSYKRAFGGLTNAAIKIGEKPTFIRNQTKENVISEIKRLYKELNRIPTTDEFSKMSSMTFPTLRKIINGQSWHSLLQEAGIPDIEMIKLKKHNVTDEELKEEILRLKNIIGRYPTYNEMRTEGKYSCDTYEQRFGTWLMVFSKLGFTDYVSQSVYKNQIHTPGKDGKIYKSHFESRFADILYKLKQENKILLYEYERKVCDNKSWTCDFVITKLDRSEIWIELDGMMKNRKDPYSGDNNEKINYYKEHNINYKIFEYRTKGMTENFNKFIGI